MITPTTGWQDFKNVDLALPNPPEGTHQLSSCSAIRRTRAG